jgi:hypothetical protein
VVRSHLDDHAESTVVADPEPDPCLTAEAGRVCLTDLDGWIPRESRGQRPLDMRSTYP